jgi:hypothetical protein
MKAGIIALTFCLLCRASSSFAQQMPVCQYRQIGTNLYDLSARYRWENAMRNAATQQDVRQLQPAKPARNWIGDEGYAYPSELSWYVVVSITHDGLIVEKDWLNLYGEKNSDAWIFLRHYPDEKTVVDGHKILFLALRDGNYRYADVTGGSRVLACYDYGIPFDVSKLRQK